MVVSVYKLHETLFLAKEKEKEYLFTNYLDKSRSKYIQSAFKADGLGKPNKDMLNNISGMDPHLEFDYDNIEITRCPTDIYEERIYVRENYLKSLIETSLKLLKIKTNNIDAIFKLVE